MPSGAIFILLIFAAFPLVIIIAVVVKLWEVRQASRWPSTQGKVVVCTVQAVKKKPGSPGYNFSDTEVSNEPHVVYEYVVDGKSYRCQRITIGEKTSGDELEEILARYPVGQDVTVYFNPATPGQAVLERDLPWGMLTAGVGCLLLFFIGGPLLAAFFYFEGVAWLEANIPNKQRAPFAAAAAGFGILAFLFGIAYLRWVWAARRWPTVPGKVVEANVEAFQVVDVRWRRRRTHYKPSILYTYEVNGRQYLGDRITLGVVISTNWRSIGQRTADKYPVGTEVQVHYDPKSPGESVLYPTSHMHIVPLLIAAGMFTLAWAAATGRLG